MASHVTGMARLLDVFVRFLRLGFIAFGGPIAHLGYFEREFVERARWLDRETFAEMVALCTALPGPTSSQVGMLLGSRRAGPGGAIAAWMAFTAPSAVALAFVGAAMRILSTPVVDGRHAHTFAASLSYAVERYVHVHPNVLSTLGGALAGVMATALAVVLFAIIALARGIVRSRFAKVFACFAFAVACMQISYAPQFAWTVLILGAVAGTLFAPRRDAVPQAGLPTVPIAIGVGALILWIAMLFFLPVVATGDYAALFAQTFRAGSLVFGGGHVVLSFLLPASNTGTQSREFQIGYGIVQAFPGPLFSFASYVGATDARVPNVFVGAAVGTIGIFLPSAFVLPAALSLWSAVARSPVAQRILAGLGVSVVGLLAATFANFVRFDLAGGVRPPLVVAFAVALALLARARWPSWAVVLAMSAGSALYASIPGLPAPLRFA